MQAFEFALALVALILVFRLIRLAIVHNKRPPRRDDPVNAELLERLNQVEERVRVLERIVTDERYDLKQQFKDLGT
ncbi:MAG TPA: hypothetical protein VNA66_00300 [Gammaproteobacteria bacterium]|nr:hypothetical protein [Gammaproteobacteria bacterium]